MPSEDDLHMPKHVKAVKINYLMYVTLGGTLIKIIMLCTNFFCVFLYTQHHFRIVKYTYKTKNLALINCNL
jgi:hypothetical protein